MALQCNLTLNRTNFPVGATPYPKAFLQCYNASAVAISVTGIEMELTTRGAKSVLPGSVAAIGAGSTVIVPALSSITIGPIDVVFPSVGEVTSTPFVNAQRADPLVMVGATVYASDDSVNIAGAAPLQLSPIRQTPAATRGGYLNFADGSNAATLATIGVL